MGKGNDIAGTKAAFEAMLSERGVFRKLEVDKSTVSAWRGYLRDGNKNISLEKMEEMLLRYGAVVKSEKVWTVPIAEKVTNKK